MPPLFWISPTLGADYLAYAWVAGKAGDTKRGEQDDQASLI